MKPLKNWPKFDPRQARGGKNRSAIIRPFGFCRTKARGVARSVGAVTLSDKRVLVSCRQIGR